MVRLLGKLLHNMIVLLGGVAKWNICVHPRRLPTSYVFFLQLSDPRDRTGNQLRQTRGRNVHETVLYTGLPQPITPSNDSTPPTNMPFKRQNFVFASQNGGQESILAKVREFVGTRYLKMAEWLLSAARSVTTILDIQ